MEYSPRAAERIAEDLFDALSGCGWGTDENVKTAVASFESRGGRDVDALFRDDGFREVVISLFEARFRSVLRHKLGFLLKKLIENDNSAARKILLILSKDYNDLFLLSLHLRDASLLEVEGCDFVSDSLFLAFSQMWEARGQNDFSRESFDRLIQMFGHAHLRGFTVPNNIVQIVVAALEDGECTMSKDLKDAALKLFKGGDVPNKY